jgi:hypothetical protein
MEGGNWMGKNAAGFFCSEFARKFSIKRHFLQMKCPKKPKTRNADKCCHQFYAYLLRTPCAICRQRN